VPIDGARAPAEGQRCPVAQPLPTAQSGLSRVTPARLPEGRDPPEGPEELGGRPCSESGRSGNGGGHPAARFWKNPGRSRSFRTSRWKRFGRITASERSEQRSRTDDGERREGRQEGRSGSRRKEPSEGADRPAGRL